MKRIYARLGVPIVLFFIHVSLAFASPSPGEAAARDFVATLNRVILFPLIGLLSGIAFIVFLWGCFSYIRGANNVSAREQGVKHITYGIIGLVIMVSAYTILTLVAATFGVDDELDEATTGYEAQLTVPLG
jgi:hypothetical protein